MIGIFSSGIAAIPHLDTFLGEPWRRVHLLTRPKSLSCIAGWGLKPTTTKARSYAERHSLPYLSLEDGFLRSRGHSSTEPPRSLVLDDIGIYYDANRPSRLEELILSAASDPQATTSGRRLTNAWRSARVSKYNHQPDVPPDIEHGFALVIDQTEGDASLVHGKANPTSFAHALEAALDEDTRRIVLIKSHPDVIAGRKQGSIDFDSALRNPRVRILSTPHHPPALLQGASCVYVVTSQVGFEALIWGVPVRTFGMPFYAGWGLTEDEQPAPDRREPVSLDALVEAALCRYPVYVNPRTGHRIEAEEAIQLLAPFNNSRHGEQRGKS